eukprot:SAG11_NODE_3439_length_2447_cov_4.018313_2_plen_76_part_00
MVMDERIISAREIRKRFPRAGGFGAADAMGQLGVVGGSAGPVRAPHLLCARYSAAVELGAGRVKLRCAHEWVSRL